MQMPGSRSVKSLMDDLARGIIMKLLNNLSQQITFFLSFFKKKGSLPAVDIACILFFPRTTPVGCFSRARHH